MKTPANAQTLTFQSREVQFAQSRKAGVGQTGTNTSGRPLECDCCGRGPTRCGGSRPRSRTHRREHGKK